MKRLIALLLCICMTPAWALAEEEALSEQITLTAGESRAFALPFSGYWESDAPEIAQGKDNVVTAYEEGWAMLSLISPEGDEMTVEVEVLPAPEDEVPALIRAAIQIGIQEWEDAGGRTFPRSDSGKPARDNKFTVWWGYDIGWCGAFVNYCLEKAGVPLEPTDTFRKVKPTETGEPHGVKEAGVPKLDTAFTNMNRITNIPRPGYLVIYGQRDYYAFVHVGLVTDVIDRGDGVYQVFTVEGNLASRIKRIAYIYDSNAPAERNMSATPEEERTHPEIFQYEPQKNNWYVNEFCMTWY